MDRMDPFDRFLPSPLHHISHESRVALFLCNRIPSCAAACASRVPRFAYSTPVLCYSYPLQSSPPFHHTLPLLLYLWVPQPLHVLYYLRSIPNLPPHPCLVVVRSSMWSFPSIPCTIRSSSLHLDLISFFCRTNGLVLSINIVFVVLFLVFHPYSW